LVRRSLEEKPEVKYDVSNGDDKTPRDVLAPVACTRHKLEEFWEDIQSDLGMTEYQTRSWLGLHHPMSRVAMAHRFIRLERRDP
jgi:hypothetical protein